MPEEYNISKQAPLFIKEPQDDLYGKQRKIRVLTSEELEEICKNAEHINLVSFSDNTLESVHVFDLIVQFSKFLKLVGVVYEPISQPIYCFVSSDNKYINIKICGQYLAWDIPETVEKIIQFADTPDIVYNSPTKLDHF